jgi:hypothetical protein
MKRVGAGTEKINRPAPQHSIKVQYGYRYILYTARQRQQLRNRQSHRGRLEAAAEASFLLTGQPEDKTGSTTVILWFIGHILRLLAEGEAQ